MHHFANCTQIWTNVLLKQYVFIDLIFTVNRIKELHKVTVRIPPDNEKSTVIRIEGDPQGVQEAKKELLELTTRMVRMNFTARCCKLDPGGPSLNMLSRPLTGERAYKGPDH